MVTLAFNKEEKEITALDDVQLRTMIYACKDMLDDEDSHSETRKFLLSRVRECRRELIKRKMKEA